MPERLGFPTKDSSADYLFLCVHTPYPRYFDSPVFADVRLLCLHATRVLHEVASRHPQVVGNENRTFHEKES